MPEAASATDRYLTFRVDDRLYAVAAREVAEVIRLPALARVPQSPAALLGLGNLRGEAAPFASLRALVGADASPDRSAARALVLTGAAPVGVAIDGAPTLVNGDGLRTADANVVARPGEQLLGVFQTAEEDVAHVLDLRAMLASAFVAREARTTERARTHVARHEETATTGTRKVISFMVGGQEFALELDVVREVIPAPDAIVSAPHSEALVVGVAPYRETLLPLLSLRGLLGFGDAAPGTATKVVVARVAGTLVGLVADQARAVLEIGDAEAEPPPAILAARAGGESQIKSIYKGEDGRRLVSILAPDGLFRKETMQNLKGAHSAADTTLSNGGEDEALAKFVVFRLGEDEFALPIDAVIEVAPAPSQITRVPRTPAFLEGVISLRGEVLPVVDQRRRFDMPVREGVASRRLIVVKSERHRAGLIVDAVSEVLGHAAEAVNEAPDLTGEQSRLVAGVINLEAAGRMIMVLDPAELLSRAERSLLDAFDSTLAE